MKSLSIIITALFVLPLCGIAPLEAQCDGTFRFVNNTGREVTDLHIEFEETGATLESHNFPGRPSTERANFEGPATNGTEKRWDIIRGRLPNKGVATLSFTSEDCRLRIRRWWWTVDDSPATEPYNNERRSGTNASGASLDRDLVAQGETVTKVKVSHPYSGRRNGERVELGINDLHVVSRKPPTVLNRTRNSEDDPAKSGGVFEEEDVTTCDCDVRQTDRPCQQVCQGQTGTLYVLNLVTTGTIRRNQEVELELKGVEAEDLQWLWWTKDGRPYTVRNTGLHRGNKDEGVPEENGNDLEGAPKEDWDEVVGNFGHPGGPRSRFAVGLFGGAGRNPFDASLDFGPESTAAVMNAIYGNPDVMARLLEGFSGEFYLGDFTGTTEMMVASPSPSTQFGTHLRFGLTGPLSVDVRGGYTSASAEGRFPVTVFPWSSETTEEPYETAGTYRLERGIQELSLGANYLLGPGRLRAGVGAYAAAQRVSNRSTVVIAGQHLQLSEETNFALSGQLRGIIQYQPIDRIFLEGGIVRLLPLSGATAGNLTAFQLGLGLYLGK
ncbi:hypothetical protein [Lewinella sp. W8]|uniref:hypothetical protein n=1 Tax=Lewinella sp. W8 TaxID=2528208 RepID=UPI00106811D6|nr:hypothetical protein [Lewinella sp. W8]MTB51664.1 hypothetical protein [Lewinella sp. W8]